AYDLARKVHSSSAIISSAELLSTLYADDGNHSKALEFYRIYINSRDSVRNEENSRNMMRQQMGYEYGKKSAADSLNFEREREVGEVKLSRQRGYTIGGFSALAIVGLLLVFVYRQRNRIASEKKRSDELLLNILPAETAEELKATGTAKTKNYDSVTVMFTDFKNFTKTAEQLSAEDLVALINLCYAEFDRIISRHRLEKIKTIGDSYMCAGGLPVANETHAEDAVAAALEMIVFIRKHNEERKRNNLPFFDIRIGLHTGQVVAGIVGIKKFAYDIWGDTVNIASRMESSGEPDRINISESTYLLVKDKFHCEYRGKVQAKNKGEIDMYFVKEETSRIP
ncbi:MAG TPA: adenylate/guanylate cyclase domain-containing protein, partial [Bacteroidia bacterium]|nr:adenylate/guanylate cyclase domain-containing protein [Bacteroidia bacterium]